MSATGRGRKKNANDDYPTPPWAIEAAMLGWEWPGGHWLEPCAGAGNVIRTVGTRGLRWTAVEIQKKYALPLQALGAEAHIGDFREVAAAWRDEGAKFDVCITNPPYSLAMEILEAALPVSKIVAMLCRVGFLESKKRHDFMLRNPPDIGVLSVRPKFSFNGVDNAAYAWMIWPRGVLPAARRSNVSRLQVLPLPPDTSPGRKLARRLKKARGK